MTFLHPSQFDFRKTPIEGVYTYGRKPKFDDRGSFTRMYSAEEVEALANGFSIAQVNHSCSHAKGTIRGLHFQHPPHDEIKVVSCLAGEIFDVIVDIRANSSTFLQWYGIELTSANHLSVIIPRGVAHGYQTLSDNASIIYFVDKAYSKKSEDGLNPLDETIGVQWPLPCTSISERDRGRAFIHPKMFRGINAT